MSNVGSLMNHLMSNAKSKTPVIGEGATEICWSDRHAYTIVEIKSAKCIVVQRDKVTRLDQGGPTDSQAYQYAPDPNGHRVTLTLRRNGKWIPRGHGMSAAGYLIGVRQEHYDYSF